MIGLLIGCARLENPPFEEPLPFLGELSAEVAPSGGIVSSAVGAPEELSLAAWPLDDGSVAGLLTSFTGARTIDLGGATVFRTSPRGPTAARELAFGAVALPLGDELFVADCPTFPRFGLTEPDAGYVELDATGEVSCGGGVFGPGATPDRVVQLDAYQRVARVHHLDRAAGTDTITAAPTSAVPAGATILLVHEPAEGEVALVLLVDGALTFVDASGETVAPGGVDGDGPEAWVGADGAARVATSEALYRWDGAALERLDEVPAPPIDAAWVEGRWRGGARAEVGEPNPGDPSVTVPTAMAVRYATDEAFEVFEPPLTPCCDEAACRALGESYLVGGFGGADGDVAVYDVWSWVVEGTDLTSARVVRPVDDTCAD